MQRWHLLTVDALRSEYARLAFSIPPSLMNARSRCAVVCRAWRRRPTKRTAAVCVCTKGECSTFSLCDERELTLAHKYRSCCERRDACSPCLLRSSCACSRHSPRSARPSRVRAPASSRDARTYPPRVCSSPCSGDDEGSCRRFSAHRSIHDVRAGGNALVYIARRVQHPCPARPR